MNRMVVNWVKNLLLCPRKIKNVGTTIYELILEINLIASKPSNLFFIFSVFIYFLIFYKFLKQIIKFFWFF